MMMTPAREKEIKRERIRIFFGDKNGRIASSFIESNIDLPGNLGSDDKEIAKEIVDAVKNKKPDVIAGVLKKHGFCTTDEDASKKAIAIKQDHYYSKLNSSIEATIKFVSGGKIPTLSVKGLTTTMRLEARLHGERSTTKYIIKQLNKAQQHEDWGKVDKYMKMLGLDEFSNDVTRKLEAEAKITKPLPRIPTAKGGLMDELKGSVEKLKAPAEATSKRPGWGKRTSDEAPAETPSHKGEILRSLKQPGAIGAVGSKVAEKAREKDEQRSRTPGLGGGSG